jgi:hypothetical protein
MILPSKMLGSDNISAPEFEIFTTTHQDGSPNIVSVTQIQRGYTCYDEQYIFSSVASTLQSVVIAELKSFSIAISESSLRNVNGIIQMNNITDFRHAHTADVDLCDLSIHHIQNIFEKVVEYGEIGIFDVEFSFWINPLSLKAGII